MAGTVIDISTTIAASKMYSVVIQQEGVDANSAPTVITAFAPGDINFSVDANYDAPFANALTFDGKIGNLMSAFGMVPQSQALTTQIWKGNSPIELHLPLTFAATTSGLIDVVSPVATLLEMCLPSTSSENSIWLNPPGPRVQFTDYTKQAKDLTSSSSSTSSSGNTLSGSASSTTSSSTGFMSLAKSNSKAAINMLVSGGTGAMDTAKSVASSVANGNVAEAAGKVVDAYSDAIAFLSNSITVTRKISLTIGNVLCFDSVVITGVSPNIRMVLDTSGQPMQATVDVSFRTHQTPRASDARRYFTGLKALNTDSSATTAASSGTATTAKSAKAGLLDKFDTSSIAAAASSAVGAATSAVSAIEDKVTSVASGATSAVSNFITAEKSSMTSSSTFATAKSYVTFGG